MQTNDRYLRLSQIVGQKAVTAEQAKFNRENNKSPRTPRPYLEPRIPISRAAWWAGVASQKFPQPVKLGSRTTVWRESDINALINDNLTQRVEGGE